jgi:hypothetical protein
MPASPLPTTDDAYAREASTWLALNGRIPGDLLHDAAAWRAWHAALPAALAASAQKAAPARAASALASARTSLSF